MIFPHKKKKKKKKLPLLFTPGLSLKELAQHSLKILWTISNVLSRIFPILNHRPVFKGEKKASIYVHIEIDKKEINVLQMV